MRILSLIAVGALLVPSKTVLSAPLVELFTSQGCYSCPPADKHLAELIKKYPDLVALEFHVDYWDDLNYGAAGTWKDPFSDAAFSKRQRQYNSHALQGKPGVYTPQMIVNGTTAQVGTRREAVRKAIKAATPVLKLTAIKKTEKRDNNIDHMIDINISGDYAADALVWLTVFDIEQVTDVVRGENHGKVMRNHHVVRELSPIADWRNGGGHTSASVPALAQQNTGCAVFVQSRDSAEILAASYCENE